VSASGSRNAAVNGTGIPVIAIHGRVRASRNGITSVNGAGISVIAIHRGIYAPACRVTAVNRADVAVITINGSVGAAGQRVTCIGSAWIKVIAGVNIAAYSGKAAILCARVAIVTPFQMDTDSFITKINGARVAIIAVYLQENAVAG